MNWDKCLTPCPTLAGSYFTADTVQFPGEDVQTTIVSKENINSRWGIASITSIGDLGFFEPFDQFVCANANGNPAVSCTSVDYSSRFDTTSTQDIITSSLDNIKWVYYGSTSTSFDWQFDPKVEVIFDWTRARLSLLASKDSTFYSLPSTAFRRGSNIGSIANCYVKTNAGARLGCSLSSAFFACSAHKQPLTGKRDESIGSEGEVEDEEDYDFSQEFSIPLGRCGNKHYIPEFPPKECENGESSLSVRLARIDDSPNYVQSTLTVTK
jgi:hypothetical protein